MARLILIFQMLIISVFVFGQKIDADVQKKISALRLKGVDTFLIYTIHCNGSMIPFDTCAYEEPKYLMWIEKGISFSKKFDYCNSYADIKNDPIDPISFYIANRTTIDKEEIKSPYYYEVRKRKGLIDTASFTSTVSHSCYHKFQILVNKDSVNKTIDSYDLNFKKFSDGKSNLNYKYNQQTLLKQLITKTHLLVALLKDTY